MRGSTAMIQIRFAFLFCFPSRQVRIVMGSHFRTGLNTCLLHVRSTHADLFGCFKGTDFFASQNGGRLTPKSRHARSQSLR